ncbi:MAG: pantoate--beta-alanine ligase [Rhodothermaceae bacterium]|nr:pantoate--beta-alanine ligase [Rhodothermaceae bacterium]MYG45074.1 pantoate--beta-alanine ligase [Rhodothermaceae bacterium]MYK63929.1 pantoate--beta-alanine ligase [Rhodothermaceae bacterium]
MKIIRTVAEMQAHADQQRMEGRTLALVPTMGSLHEGHLSLVRRAKAEADHVTVSIFVNPTQFGPNEDFKAYPRNFQMDCELLEEVGGVSTIFAPDEATLYSEGSDQQRVWVTCPEMSRQLCGKYRPGHFEGVLTVVMKLFAACKPHISVFGLKDIQQYILLKQMIQDLALDIKVIGGEIVRESNGLAYSSRNEYLTADERSQASIISEAINSAARMIEDGEENPMAVTGLIQEMIHSVPQAKLQYAEIVTASKLEPVGQFTPGLQVIVAVAVYFRHIRLIDNAFALIPVQ